MQFAFPVFLSSASLFLQEHWNRPLFVVIEFEIAETFNQGQLDFFLFHSQFCQWFQIVRQDKMGLLLLNEWVGDGDDTKRDNQVL